MKSTAFVIRRLAAVTGIAALFTGCSDTVGVLHGPTPVDPLFQSYVALGNSITAGYQSGGINDSTQQQSYAYLLAHAMNTRYAYAALDTPGCPPPVVNFQTQARVSGKSSTYCGLRIPTSATTALNNVAVPGAASADPTSASTAASNALTTLILGGKTQVQRAADAQPTFVSAWIGNNDVLPAAVSGLLTATQNVSPGITPEAQFETNYNAMVTGLKQISSIRGGVLIGVIQVAAAPVLFPAAALFNPAFKHGLDQFTARVPGDTTVILSSCVGSQSLISFEIVSAIRNRQHPDSIGCEKQSIPGTAVGDIFVLDAGEQAQLTAAVNGYNAFIQATANTLGWAYYDPNVTLTTLKNSGCIATVLNLGDPLQPFGPCVTLDGIHPSAQAQKTVANALIDVINAKYSTTLVHVP